MTTVGVIGGSGLYVMESLEGIEEVRLSTPFGDPSDSYIVGTLAGTKMVFLSRHGRGHRILPHEINFRANIHGMKQLGVEWIFSVSAVGSMKEHIHPGHMVVPDQFFDRTKSRVPTFFGNGVAAHVTFADPVCPVLWKVIGAAADQSGATVHKGGTYLCMEGPQFSTRAESKVYRGWGVDVIGMTNIPEAKLAREAEICYATLALSTDYDCWHETEEDVSIESVLEIMRVNVETAQRILKLAVTQIPAERTCGCASSLEHAILTDRSLISVEVRERLSLIAGKYL
ncbi:MAG: S-methyl-5'-thioadenosine phosphorylase [Deltaproteobacteria bacterium]|nr:S-methyl-5'-thioadenosine phosphorylase [Deltaproteobacteria bacterium]